MKEIKRVGFLFCLVSTMFWLLPVIGCQHTSSGGDWSGESEEEPKENTPNEEASVVSRWVNSTEDYEEILTFYDDGTYTYEKYEKDVLTEGQKGTYSGDISSDEETKLTATEDYSNGEWGNTTSSGGFYVKITGDSIEVAVWWTEDNETEKKGESSLFSSETENDDGADEGNIVPEDNEGGFSNENPDYSNPETDNNGDDDTGGTGNSGNTGTEDGENTSDENEKSYFTVAEATEYITSLTENGTYYVKVVDDTETSCSALKTALVSLNNKDIYIELDLSESIVSIGERAFSNTDSTLNYSLVSIILPNSCTSIGNYAFTYCPSLKSVTIPFGVTSIGYEAFYQCWSLVDVTLPSSLISIREWAFASCELLETVGLIPESVTSIGSHAFAFCYLLASINIPKNLTTIEDSVFSSCYALTSIEIPSDVTYIGNSAFYKTALTSVTIPAKVEYIGYYAFRDCSLLTETIFENPNGWTATSQSSGKEEVCIEASNLGDTSIAATYLSVTYAYDTWTRN